MSFEVVETGKDERGEYVKVWDGGRDKKGHREGIHIFYGPGNATFRVGNTVQISLKEIERQVTEGT